MKLRTALKILFFYLALCGLFILTVWAKYLYNIASLGGAEIADTLFALGFILVTLFYALLALWTRRLYRQQELKTLSHILQTFLIFALGVGSSVCGLIFLYN
jgi:hypothetical protein